MIKTFPLAVVCCFLLAAAIRADAPPAEPPIDPAVAKLVEQLGDNDFRVREEASRRLKAIGLPALPALRKALTCPDAEVRRRANELVPALETAALLAAKRVTFKIVDKPIKDAFDELIRQTGYHIEYNGNDPNKLYSFDCQDVTFWEAIDKISRASGLLLQQGYGDDHARLYPGDGYSPHVCYHGAFRFNALSFNQFRTIDFTVANSGAPRQQTHEESLTLTFTVFVEPRMALLGVGEPHLDAAYDNEKNSLLLPAAVPDPLNNNVVVRQWSVGKYGNGARMFNTQTQVVLRRPSEQATTAKVIRGTVPVTLLAEQKDAIVTDKLLAAKGAKVQIGTTQFAIEEVTETPGKQYQIKMAVTEDMQGDPNDWSWVNSLWQRLQVLDAKGNPMQLYQSSVNNQAFNHVEMMMTYGSMPGANPEPPAKLVYNVWVTRQEEVPFEFKDLPLP